MNAAVSRTLSLIPDRVSRSLSGSTFDPRASAACAHPERIAHLSQFLNWLGPLNPVTKDDLQIFGLMTPYGKPAIVGAEEGDDDTEPPAPEPQASVHEHAEAPLV